MCFGTGRSFIFMTYSSSGLEAITPCVTFALVSKPTKSSNLKLPVDGHPIASPVNLSTSVTVKPNSSVNSSTLFPEKKPMRLAINAGVSLHKTVFFPKTMSPKCMKKSMIFWSVSDWGMISNKDIYLAGLKKCVPQKCFLKSSLLPSAKTCNRIPNVLEVIKLAATKVALNHAEPNTYLFPQGENTFEKILQARFQQVSDEKKKALATEALTDLHKPLRDAAVGDFPIGVLGMLRKHEGVKSVAI